MTSIAGGDHECGGRYFVCPKCGDVVPVYYVARLVCYSCHLDLYVRPGYAKAEQYRWDPAWGHSNATKRPPLGIPFLDETAPRIGMMLLMHKGRPRAGGFVGRGGQ